MARVVINEERCKGCGLCVRACAKQLVQISTTKLNSKGYHPAEVKDMEQCVACAMCARTCPDAVIEIYK